jgi:hypothetical protein
MFCALRVHKFGPATQLGTFPKAFVPENPWPCPLFAIARALPAPIIFALCSLNVKFLFCPVRISFAADLLFPALWPGLSRAMKNPDGLTWLFGLYGLRHIERLFIET